LTWVGLVIDEPLLDVPAGIDDLVLVAPHDVPPGGSWHAEKL
jgi:hypothetical protein